MARALGHGADVRKPLLAISLVFSGCFLIEDEPVNHRGDAVDATAPDASRDAANDTSTVVIVDAGPAPMRPDADAAACKAIGGTCAFGRWANCPPGTQPADDDIHRGCGEPRGNFCCVPVPIGETSSCAQSDAPVDCFPTADCHPCFSPTTEPSLSCASGRTCCAYTCPD